MFGAIPLLWGNVSLPAGGVMVVMVRRAKKAHAFILRPRRGTEQARGCHLGSSSSPFQRDDLKA